MTTVQLAQNPVRALTARIGELKEDADRQIANLTLTLKQLDDIRAALNEHGVQMVVDLGSVGNAAAHARTADLADKGQPAFIAAVNRVA